MGSERQGVYKECTPSTNDGTNMETRNQHLGTSIEPIHPTCEAYPGYMYGGPPMRRTPYIAVPLYIEELYIEGPVYRRHPIWLEPYLEDPLYWKSSI